MMHERGKSDSAVVATKPANKAERSAAELVEQRAGTKGNADQQSTRRAQDRESVSQALGRIRQVRRQTPEVGAVCIKVHVRICAGGVGQLTSLPRPRNVQVEWRNPSYADELGTKCQ